MLSIRIKLFAYIFQSNRNLFQGRVKCNILINSAFYEFYQKARNNLLISISETKLAIIVDFITQIKQLTMLILYCPLKRNNNKYIAYIIYLEH